METDRFTTVPNTTVAVVLVSTEDREFCRMLRTLQIHVSQGTFFIRLLRVGVITSVVLPVRIMIVILAESYAVRTAPATFTSLVIFFMNNLLKMHCTVDRDFVRKIRVGIPAQEGEIYGRSLSLPG